MADGVLPVCLGTATKLCDMLADKSKTYEAVLLLGVETDTQDITGTILAQAPVKTDKEQVKKAVLSFLGPYNQVPPMYSALKIDGKKLYELARQGKEVERAARPVEILDIQIKNIALPRVELLVSCSKGTYIRTLCYDIGKKLGCGGCMEALIRTRVSGFLAEDSLTLSQLQKLRDEGNLTSFVWAVDKVFEEYPLLRMKPEFDRLVHNGNPIYRSQTEGKDLILGAPFRIYDSTGRFIGVYGPEGQGGLLKPVKVFLGGNER